MSNKIEECISKIWTRKDGSKMLTIPKRSALKSGDYVLVKKVL